jgi:hypothetical protein
MGELNHLQLSTYPPNAKNDRIAYIWLITITIFN